MTADDALQRYELDIRRAITANLCPPRNPQAPPRRGNTPRKPEPPDREVARLAELAAGRVQQQWSPRAAEAAWPFVERQIAWVLLTDDDYRGIIEARVQRRLTNDQVADAENCKQDIIARAVSSWSTCKNPGARLKWLLTLAGNVIVDWIRGTATARARSTSLDPSDENTGNGPGGDPIKQVPSLANVTMRYVDVARALASLPSRDQRAIHLTYWAECSNEEIGEKLGITVPAVKALKHRALRRLRTRLDGYGPAPDSHTSPATSGTDADATDEENPHDA